MWIVHPCDTPEVSNKNFQKLIWQCDGCGKVWVTTTISHFVAWKPARWYHRLRKDRDVHPSWKAQW